jgi:hypothetical protein
VGQAMTGLIGAALGATTALLSSYLAFRYQLRLEEKKSKIAKDDALLKELRSYIAEAQKEMFSALHSMAWVAWHGWKERALGLGLINDELASQYHKEVHLIVPQLLGHLAVIASIDERAHSTLAERWHELQKTEDKIADALVNYKTSAEDSLNKLAECHSSIMGLYKSLPRALADSLRPTQS